MRFTPKAARAIITAWALGGVLAAGSPALAQQKSQGSGETVDSDTSKESGRTKEAAGPKAVPLDDRIKAVVGKKFQKRLRFEVFPWLGVSLNDAFYRYYHGGIAGTFHLFEGLAFEGGLSAAPVRQVLEPVIFLRQSKSAVPQVARYFGNVYGNVQFSPIYGKMALFGEWIIHHDLFFLGGLGLALDSAEWYVHPQVHMGVGERIYLFEWMALRAEVRGSAYPQGRLLISNIQSQMTALVGVSFFIPPFAIKDTPGLGKRK